MLGEKVSDVQEALVCPGVFTPASLETPVGPTGPPSSIIAPGRSGRGRPELRASAETLGVGPTL